MFGCLNNYVESLTSIFKVLFVSAANIDIGFDMVSIAKGWCQDVVVIHMMTPWCSGYHYSTISFTEARS